MKSEKIKLNGLVLLLISLLNLSPAEAKISKFKDGRSLKQVSSDLLKKYRIDSSHLSVQILDGNSEVFALNENAVKNPASITKLATSFGVLKRLPPGFKAYTQLFTDGENLYLKGGGDPSFVSENMWFLVNEFTRTGIKKINGDIIVDENLFDEIRYDDSRQSVRVDRAYDSPVGAMSFNWNAVNIFVKPGELNKKAVVVVDPENQFFELINNTKTVNGNVKKELSAGISNAEKLITVTGEVSVDASEKAIYKSIENPALWSGANLRFFLAQRNIEVVGKIKTGKVPENLVPIATYESKNLSLILSDMNKFSNNFVAEMLTKILATQKQKTKASLKQGVEIINDELRKIGLSEKQIVVKNPSGLTNDNRCSAAAMNKILSEMKKDFSIYPTILASLPIAGVDGTLRKRYKETIGEGWVRAKTGYLDGVVTLAGYAGRRDGKILTFTFLYNGPRDESLVREYFDQLLLAGIK